MKYFIIAALLLMLAACTKTTSSTAPVSPPSATQSTFDITFNGKTYSLVSDSTTAAIAITALTTTSSSSLCGVAVTARNSQMQCTLTGIKDTSNTAIGIYRSGNADGTMYGTIQLIDVDDGNKKYTSDFTGADSSSTITVAVSNSSECKGTFSVILSYNGHYYPATGDFDFKH